MTATLAIPKHPDAVGYLNDLKAEINESWFEMICEIAIQDGVSQLDPKQIEELLDLYVHTTNTTNYLGLKTLTKAVMSATPPSIPSDRLEKLSNFKNFKRLSSTLTVRFDERITLLFGTNGSGKSSLCEALKVLAQKEQPMRPLKNVRATNDNDITTEFCYKFQSDSSDQIWSIDADYGLKEDIIRYFDTEVAIGNLKNAIEPERLVELTPFKLHVFGLTKSLTEQFRTEVRRKKDELDKKLNISLKRIRVKFESFINQPLASIDKESAQDLLIHTEDCEEFNDQENLKAKRAEVSELEKTFSEEGLELLRVKFKECQRFLDSIRNLLGCARALLDIEPVNKRQLLQRKKEEQQVMAKALLPERDKFEQFISMLREASALCQLENASGESCPLCKRSLGDDEIQLFKDYQELLSNQLEEEIVELENELKKADDYQKEIQKIDWESWKGNLILDKELIKFATPKIHQILFISEVPSQEAKIAYESLNQKLKEWERQLESKRKILEIAKSGREETIKKVKALNDEILSLEYASTIATNLDLLSETRHLVEELEVWDSKLLKFPTLLRKLTTRAKEAYEDLVVTDFETRLNDEFKALTEKDMKVFGVTLARKGSDASVTVVPRIGETDIIRVLSEGEQRIYALALFFAEIESSSNPVIVFDDPICSFDYNFIYNYCIRMRDFALDYPDKQIIVCTHCWEFFVQLQVTLNKAGLANDLSLQVIENCALSLKYSEKIDKLKSSIEDVLAKSTEPTECEKEILAGNMRRLIEAVINTYVFNNQRHQFKQKSQQVSAFQKFTKVTPLLDKEAAEFRDLYAMLSVSEHDDPRNAYTNTDKTIFQTRYNRIQDIENAIKKRIPMP